MRLIAAVALFLLAAASSAALAQDGGIRISPVRLYVGASENATAVTVTNQDAAERRFQVQVERWTQSADGADELAPTQDLIANPPMFVLKPGQARVVRVGFVDPAPVPVEQAYRVYIREVPGSPSPDGQARGDGEAPTGIQVLRRFSLPLFRAPTEPAHRDLQWSASVTDGSVTLRAYNRGNVHERRSDLKIYADSGNTLLEHAGGINDMLPGSTRTWTFRTSRAGDVRLRLESISDRQNQSFSSSSLSKSILIRSNSIASSHASAKTIATNTQHAANSTTLVQA